MTASKQPSRGSEKKQYGRLVEQYPDFDPADPPLCLSHTEVVAAVKAGHAKPLSKLITDFVKYGDHWWILYKNGWILIDHSGLHSALEKQAAEVRETGTYLGGPC